MNHKQYTEKYRLKRYLDENSIKNVQFAREMNVVPSQVHYWLKRDALYVEDEGIRKVILPRLVATVRF